MEVSEPPAPMWGSWVPAGIPRSEGSVSAPRRCMFDEWDCVSLTAQHWSRGGIGEGGLRADPPHGGLRSLRVVRGGPVGDVPSRLALPPSVPPALSPMLTWGQDGAGEAERQQAGGQRSAPHCSGAVRGRALGTSPASPAQHLPGLGGVGAAFKSSARGDVKGGMEAASRRAHSPGWERGAPKGSAGGAGGGVEVDA